MVAVIVFFFFPSVVREHAVGDMEFFFFPSFFLSPFSSYPLLRQRRRDSKMNGLFFFLLFFPPFALRVRVAGPIGEGMTGLNEVAFFLFFFFFFSLPPVLGDTVHEDESGFFFPPLFFPTEVEVDVRWDNSFSFSSFLSP